MLTGKQNVILSFWAVLVFCVAAGSLLPAASPVMQGVSRLHVDDRALHFCGYLTLSCLPVIAFPDRRRGFIAAASMFLLGLLVEVLQYFAPGRAVELGDLVANGAGVGCGVLLALPLRALVALP